MLHAIWEDGVIVIGNGLDLGNGVSSGSLYKCEGWPSTMTLPLVGSDGSLTWV